MGRHNFTSRAHLDSDGGLVFPISGLRMFALAVSDQENHREKWGGELFGSYVLPISGLFNKSIDFPTCIFNL